MATLPTPYSRRRTPQAARPIASISPDAAGAVGGALARAGSTIAGIGAEIEDKNQALRLAGAKTDFLRAGLQAEDDIPQGADYEQWTAAYKERMSEAQREIAATLKGPAKEKFTAMTADDIVRGEARIRGKAKSQEADQGRAYLDDQIEKNIGSALTANDTEARQEFLLASREAIDAAEGSGYITAQRASAMRRGVAEDYARRRLSMLNPEERLVALGAAPQGRLSAEIVGVIEAAGGQDAATLKRIAVLESAGNPGAVNSMSGAAGLFQFMPATAAQFGLANAMDAGQSARAAAALLQANRSVLGRRIGREPTGGELYLAHQQGAGGASALLQNRDANVVDALAVAYDGDRQRATKAVTQNGGKTTMSAGAFADLWIQKFNGVKGYGPSDGTSPDAGLSQYLPPDQVAKMRQLAQKEYDQQLQRQQAEYASGFDQYLDAVSAGADVSAEIAAQYSDQMINANIAEVETRDLMRETRDLAVQQAEYAQRLSLATPEEIGDMAKELQSGEVQSATDLALAPSRERAEASFIAAAREDLKRRQEDPAKYVSQAPQVQQAAQNVKDAPQDYARATLAEQNRIGIATPRILSGSMAQGYAQQFNDMAPDVAAQSLVEFREQWGDFGPRVSKEMEEAGLSPEYSVAMRHANNPGLAAEIAGLKDLDVKELREAVPSSAVTDMNAEVSESMADYIAAFEAGDVTGVATETLNLNMGVAEKLILKRMRGGMDPTAAVEDVMGRMFPEEPINTDRMKLVIPEQHDVNSVERYLDQMMEGDALRKAKPIPLDDPRLPEFADLEVLIASAESRGVWLNNDSGDGAVLHIDAGGYLLPVQTEEGFYEVKYDAVENVSYGSRLWQNVTRRRFGG